MNNSNNNNTIIFHCLGIFKQDQGFHVQHAVSIHIPRQVKVINVYLSMMHHRDIECNAAQHAMSIHIPF